MTAFEGNKVNESDIYAAIQHELTKYVLLPDGRTTVCLLTLDNGYTVRGESSCVDKANYDREVGEQWAFKDAFRKVWPLLGFRLADQLAFGQATFAPDGTETFRPGDAP